MSALKLYQYYRSTCSWRLRWAMIYKGISFEAISVNLLKCEHNQEQFLQVNPSGLVPSLEVNEETFAESVAILEWLEEAYPKVSLMPVDPLSRLRVRQLCQVVSSGIQPLQNLRVQRSFSSEIVEQHAYAQLWIKAGFTAYERLLERTAGTYSFAESLSLADICLIPQCYNALRFGVSVEEFPTIHRIYQHCLQLPHYLESVPEKYH